MPVNLISEEEVRLALNPYRVDPEKFAAAVRQRVSEGARQKADPLSMMSPLLRSAASFLPLEVLTAGEVSRTAVQSASIAGTLSKLLGYVAFPAISLFVLLGSAIFGAGRVRRIQTANGAQTVDADVVSTTAKRWWQDHRWGGWLLCVATIAMAWWGATWLMFLAYIASTLILLYVLKSFAKIGIGNRVIVGESCGCGLALLGQAAGFAGVGDADIHLIDPALLVPLFFAGSLVIAILVARGSKQRYRFRNTGLFAAVTLVFSIWFLRPFLWPATAQRINAYVESFDRAEFSSASWRNWEVVASWSVQSGPAPNLSRPRQLLAKELANPQDDLPMILGSAFRTGLMQSDQIRLMRDYETKLRALLEQPATDRISALDYSDWVIRAAVLRGDLTPAQRDYLADRLHVTLRSFLSGPNGTLQEPLLATQLLEFLGRPVDPAQYQVDMHAMLLRFYAKQGGGFHRAGGFKVYESLKVGELQATSNAVRLMEVYGIPKRLDVDSVRSFLRPSFTEFSPAKWVAAVTRDRLERLPGIKRVSWFERVYYERTFLAAMVLIGLCIYATAISPNPREGSERR